MEDTFHREFTDTVSLAPGVKDLPNMQGSGKVRDLWEAASLSTEPQTQLTTYSAAASRAGQLSQIDTLLLGWANAALTHWVLSNALVTCYLSGSNTSAMGGDLAYG